MTKANKQRSEVEGLFVQEFGMFDEIAKANCVLFFLVSLKVLSCSLEFLNGCKIFYQIYQTMFTRCFPVCRFSKQAFVSSKGKFPSYVILIVLR